MAYVEQDGRVYHYEGAPLRGCVADAKAMASLLATHHDGDPNFDVALLTSDKDVIDRPTLRARLGQLFQSARDTDLLFYFSGHGAQSLWGTELVTQDRGPNALGISADELVTLSTFFEEPQKAAERTCRSTGGRDGHPMAISSDRIAA
jgi:hypothetical protein